MTDAKSNRAVIYRRALSTTLRATDVTARLHGDVFAVLAADVVPEKVAITVDRIRSALGIGRSDGLRIHAHLAMDGGLIAAFDKARAAGRERATVDGALIEVPIYAAALRLIESLKG